MGVGGVVPKETASLYQRRMSLLVAVRGGCCIEKVLDNCVGSQIEKKCSCLRICEVEGGGTAEVIYVHMRCGQR